MLFRKLGIYDEVWGKSRMIPAEPVGQVIARGEAELGFQQVSELLPVQGIELVGPLLRFLASPGAAAAIRKSGMEPLSGTAPR